MKTVFLKTIIAGDEPWCFAYNPETKRQSSEWVGETSPRPKKLKFRRFRTKTMLINFFDSQGVVHKEFVPEGKTANTEFYKGVMHRLLKCIQRARPAAFCFRDFFLLHDNVPAHKAVSVGQILTPKNVTTLSTPILSRFISARLFSLPQVENEVKKNPLCGCCWDSRSRNWWIKGSPKRGIFCSFSETVRLRKSLYICQWNLFWIKSVCVFLTCLRFLKKNQP